MMRYFPTTDRSTTVDPRRQWSPIGPPSTTTASLGQSSWNSFKKQNSSSIEVTMFATLHPFTSLPWTQSLLLLLTLTSMVLVCELMLALVSASGSPHIWQRRLMNAWSGIRTPTSWGAHGRVNNSWVTWISSGLVTGAWDKEVNSPK